MTLFRNSAYQLREKVENGEISASEIIDAYLKRIARFEPQVSSLLAVFEEKAREKAQEIDQKKKQGKKLGKLAGVPIIIKDNMHIRGELTTCASKFLANYRAPFDATSVRLLEEEDAIFIGKANLDEFAMGSTTENSAYKKTKNPWNLACNPGGSSGGSAAAVAARLAPLATGTDTGGSIRQPAAFNGIVGFKPTYGRVSRYGLVAFGSSLDQIGPFATNVRDAALMMEVIARYCQKDATSLDIPQEPFVEMLSGSMKGKKIGVPWHFLEDLKPEAKENFDKAIATCKELGAEIIDVDLDILRYSIAVYYIIATAEASTNLARFDGIRFGVRSKRAKNLQEVYDYSREEGFGPEVKNRILLGTYVLSSGFQDAYYKKAQKVRTLIIEKYNEAFSKCDLIAMPVSPFPAFPIGAIHEPLQLYLQDIYTISVNLAGLPAISVPSGFNPERKPFGLQLIGPQRADGKVLQAAHLFENATQYSNEIPPGFEGEL